MSWGYRSDRVSESRRIAPALPYWLCVPVSAAIFAAIGPLAGMIGFFLVPPFFLMIFFAAPFLPSFVPMVYGIGWIPAAITGAFAAIASPFFPLSRPKLYYFSTAAIGGTASSIVSLVVFRSSYDDSANQVFYLAFFVSGVVASLVCTRVVSLWLLRRDPAPAATVNPQ